MPQKLGVGIIGAGPVTQAIHLPALARLAERFEVREIMDADAGVAEAVARRAGARATGSVEALLANPDVDVVAICSPHRFHAEQTLAACRAGKKAVLCEKPLTLSVAEAEAVAEVQRETGVPVIVGTMHTFDAAWKWARESWGEMAGSAHAIRSSIILPPNARFEDFATEVVARPADVEADLSDAAVRAQIAHLGLMAVGIHNMPHLRSFLPPGEPVRILDAEGLQPPFGYRVLAQAGECRIDLRCLMYGTWKPSWIFEAYGTDRRLHIDFTPSYVQAGSASASISTPRGTTSNAPTSQNGYVEEWDDLARLALGELPAPDLSVAVEDLRLAMSLADATAEFISKGAGQR